MKTKDAGQKANERLEALGPRHGVEAPGRGALWVPVRVVGCGEGLGMLPVQSRDVRDGKGGFLSIVPSVSSD